MLYFHILLYRMKKLLLQKGKKSLIYVNLDAFIVSIRTIFADIVIHGKIGNRLPHRNSAVLVSNPNVLDIFNY